MNFTFSEDLLMLKGLAKEFTNGEIKPIAQRIDEEEKIPEQLIKKLAEVGFFGTSFPEEYGGGGFGKVGYCIMMEEIARGCSSTATMVGAHQSIGTNAIYIGGSEELKKKYLPRLCSGEMIASFALTEPEAGSDTFNLKTEAKKKGDKWILNGSKIWITNAGIANLISVFARTEKGITGFAVEANSPGITIGPPEKKLGIKGSTTNSITFENVEVPDENMIGREGRGFIIAMNTIRWRKIDYWSLLPRSFKRVAGNINKLCKASESNLEKQFPNFRLFSLCLLKWLLKFIRWIVSFIDVLMITIREKMFLLMQQ